MIRINSNYHKLRASYLFSEIAKRVAAFEQAHPEIDVIKLGIGDVTLPLPQACVDAMRAATDELAASRTFRGYGPEQGYPFLREKVAQHDFRARGCAIDADEVFISDGTKCDSGNFQELFDTNVRVAIPDPVYPVYVDTNVMAGRTGACRDGRYEGLVYLDSTEDNGYVPPPPDEQVDLVYLCFPNNPTGAVATHEALRRWVEYAHRHQALILFDAAYVAFIRDDTLPHSIYEIEGAREVAVEFRSFSKSAGFTGTRCAYTVVPKDCRAFDADGKPCHLHALWNRRHCTKFNGVSYPVQRAAEAVYTEEGRRQARKLTDTYLGNAAIIRDRLAQWGYHFVGGENSPYIWVKTVQESWAFFDRILNQAGVVTTPGAGFGACGEGYIRISAFNHRAQVEEAMDRLSGPLGCVS